MRPAIAPHYRLDTDMFNLEDFFPDEVRPLKRRQKQVAKANHRANAPKHRKFQENPAIEVEETSSYFCRECKLGGR